MSDIFISYARSTEGEARRIGEALRSLGYGVWRDDELPAHRDYSEVIEERLRAAKAVVVVWSADAARSQWVRAEADIAREKGTLVQLSLDAAPLPMPFSRIQCADLRGWTGDPEAPGWRKVTRSVAELVGEAVQAAAPGGRPAPEAGSSPDKSSLGVMPFANLTGDAKQDYFVDGMMEEIVGALGRIRSIFVVGSGSSLYLKGKALSAREAGDLLGVRYLLEGSVRNAGGRVRITVRLVEAASGDQVWTERYEGPLEEVFDLQDRVALGVAGAIEPNLLQAEIARSARRPTDNPTSYDHYLRAWALGVSFERENLLAALDHLERAVALDPAYGAALAFAGLLHAQVAHQLPAHEREPHARRGHELARRALEVAPNDALVLSGVADTLALLGENGAAVRRLIDRALALNPASSLAWWESGANHVEQGRMDLGVEHLEKSISLDPLSPLRPRTLTWIAAARFAQGRFEEAAALLAESEQLLPAYTVTRHLMAACYGHLGDAPAARRAMAWLDAAGDDTEAGDTEALGRWLYRREEHLAVFREGIALARAKADGR